MTAQYEINYKGMIIRCSSVLAAVALFKALGEDKSALGHTPWDRSVLSAFLASLGRRQRAVLKELAVHSSGISDTDLCKNVGIASGRAMAGVLSGITKQAMKSGIEVERVYSQTTTHRAGKPIRRYYLSPSLVTLRHVIL